MVLTKNIKPIEVLLLRNSIGHFINVTKSKDYKVKSKTSIMKNSRIVLANSLEAKEHLTSRKNRKSEVRK